MKSKIKAKLRRILHRALIALVTSEEDQYRDYWQWRWFGWEDIPWPWQAGEGDAALYRKFLETYAGPGARVLILGATPALRIIAAENNAEVSCADFSLPMLSRMGKYVEEKIPGATDREIWFRGDWFKIPFPENYFDMVFGDNVFMFIHPARRSSFLRKIRSTLKPQGFFATRTRIIDESRWNVPPERVFEKFWERFPDAKNVKSSVPYLSQMLLNWSWDEKTEKTSRERIRNAVASYLHTLPDGERRQFLDRFLKRAGIGIDFYFAKGDIINKRLADHFTLIQKMYAAAPPSPMKDFVNFCPSYLLRKDGS